MFSFCFFFLCGYRRGGGCTVTNTFRFPTTLCSYRSSLKFCSHSNLLPFLLRLFPLPPQSPILPPVFFLPCISWHLKISDNSCRSMKLFLFCFFFSSFFFFFWINYPTQRSSHFQKNLGSTICNKCVNSPYLRTSDYLSWEHVFNAFLSTWLYKKVRILLLSVS